MVDIAIIDKVEDDSYNGKDHKKVTDKSGRVFNVKYGREGKLKAKWDLLVPGKSIELTWGSYQDKPFVEDFKVVEGVEGVAKLTPQLDKEPLPTPPPDPTRKSIERQKSLDVAERWCSMKAQNGIEMKVFDVLVVAKMFESYLENGVVVEKEK